MGERHTSEIAVCPSLGAVGDKADQMNFPEDAMLRCCRAKGHDGQHFATVATVVNGQPGAAILRWISSR